MDIRPSSAPHFYTRSVQSSAPTRPEPDRPEGRRVRGGQEEHEEVVAVGVR